MFLRCVAALLLLSAKSAYRRRCTCHGSQLASRRLYTNVRLSLPNEHSTADSRSKPWFLYLLECSDGSYYAGISTDVAKRVAKHNKGFGAKYTRGRLPVALLHSKEYANRSLASKAEWEIKQLPRSQKTGFFFHSL